MFFGLTFEKVLLIGVIAALIIGPERLPQFAESFTRFIKQARDYLRGAKDRVKDEMGPDFDDVDWRKLDPRQYDPRRIIREALLDDAPVATVRAASAGAAAAATSSSAAANLLADGELPPFDTEAT